MGKSAPSPPPAPDYAAAATAQGQANLTSAQQGSVISNPNIISPYGNQTVTWGAADPNLPGGAQQATVTQSLTPDAQAALTAQQHVQLGEANLAQQGRGQASSLLGTPFQYQGPALQTSLANPGGVDYGPSAGQYGLASGINTRGVAAMPVNAGTTGQQALMQRLQPEIDQTNAALSQRLANQGITLGSEAYNNAMRTQGQNNNDLTSQAALQGINLDMSANNQGFNQAATLAQARNAAIGQNFGQAATSAGLYNNAQNQQFNQGLQSATFGNNAQQALLQQQLGLYNQPLNQITSLMSGSQIQNPQFQQFSGQNVQAAPLFNAAQQQANYNQGIYGQQMAGYHAGINGIASLGAAALPFVMSDRRLKTNIVQIGQHPVGVPAYEYDILGRHERGVMAQDLLAVMPEAVALHPSGYLMVDYDKIGGRP